MDNIAGSKSSLRWAVHLSVAFLVVLWLIPTVGLLVSSFRTTDQISTGGWWRALMTAEHNLILRTAPPSTQTQINGKYVVTGSLAKSGTDLDIRAWGVSSRAIDNLSLIHI